MEPFCFNLEEESGYIDYRFRGSYIFDKEYVPWYVDCVECGEMVLLHEEESRCVPYDQTDEYLFGVPEHGWIAHGKGCLYIPAGFPERKWKYGYQPELDTMHPMSMEAMQELARPVRHLDRLGFLAGNGVFSRKIAAKDNTIYCHEQPVGVVKEGKLSILTKYDFLLYEFPEDYEVSVNDNI